MRAIRRVGLLFFILFIGILLGTFGLQVALLTVTPLFLIWFMLWDEKQYTRARRKMEHRHHHYSYRKFQ